MSTAQLSKPYLNIGDLKEPLISDPVQQEYEQGLLRSFLHNQFPSQYDKEGKRIEDEDEKAAARKAALEQNAYKPPLAHTSGGADHQLIDFYIENKNIFRKKPNPEGESDDGEDVDDEENNDEEDDDNDRADTGDQDGDGSPKMKIPPQISDLKSDRYAFFKQATAQHSVPTTKLIHMAFLPSDPTTFATVTKATKFFAGDLQLKEFMCLEDYKTLTKIRLRNYIFVLRMFTQVDSSLYPIVKRKLMQIKKVCQYVQLLDKNVDPDDEFELNFKNEVNIVYQRLGKDKPIHDLEDEEPTDFLDENGKQKEYEDFRGEDDDENDDDDDNYYHEEEEGEDSEYQNFYKKSTFTNYGTESYFQSLLLEEEKWVKRAQWLEEVVEKFRRGGSDVNSWVKWFEAKLNSLRDLDIPVRGNENLKPESGNQHVFYLHSFLKEYFDEQNKKLESSGNSDSTKDQYSKDQQVYIDEQNFYPKVKFDAKEGYNNHDPFVRVQHNVRDKLCLKIQRREVETEYFLTVFKRRNLGNEKVYEKRINTNGRVFYECELEFHPRGNFLRFSFQTKNVKARHITKEQRIKDLKEQRDKEREERKKSYEENGQEYSEEEVDEHEFDDEKSQISYKDETEKKIDMIFPLEAHFKNPLIIKPDSTLMGFYGEKYFYAFKRVNLLVQKASKKKVEADPEFTADPTVPGDDLEEPPTEEGGIQAPLTGDAKNEAAKDNDEEKDSDNNSEKSMKLKRSKIVKTEEKEYLRIFEYDLHNFSKVKVHDLNAPHYMQVLDYLGYNKSTFGKYKDGFFRIYIHQDLNSPDKDKSKEYHYIILKNKEECILSLNDKRFKFTKDQGNNNVACELICMNEKGDKIMLIYRNDEGMNYVRLTLDTKLKISGKSVFKQDNLEFKAIKEAFPLEDKPGQSFNFKIIPTATDFIILANGDKKKEEIFVYFNEQFVTKYECNIDDLHFNIVDGALNNIFCIKQSQLVEVARQSNNFSYSVWERAQSTSQTTSAATSVVDKTTEWYTMSHEIFNRQKIVCFPYAFFFYNHDQLYMKDLQQHGLHGYYYMNNYLGIDQKKRPLTVQAFPYWNQLCINIPVIESNYLPSQFSLLNHQLLTFPSINQPYKLNNTLLKHWVYGFNEQIMSSLNNWASVITNSDGLLDKDVRILFEGNCLKIEKWEKNKCTHRMITTHYYQNRDPRERDITNIDKIEDSDNQYKCLTYKEECYKLVLFQRPEGMVLYNVDMYYCQDYYYDWSDPNALNTAWEYAEDDLSNPVTDVLFDTLAPKQINLYIIKQNSRMHRFTASIPCGDQGGDKITFEEFGNIYNMEKVFAGEKAQGGSGKGATNSKTLKIYRNFIANDIFYSQCTLIKADGGVEQSQKAIDLKAEIFENKLQVGSILQNPYKSNVWLTDVSINQARLVCWKHDEKMPMDPHEDSTQLVDTLIITPLFNTRVLPQFWNGQFCHPVVPMVDRIAGYTSVFTLNLESTLFIDESTNESGYFFDIVPLINHQNSKTHKWKHFFNNSPGMLVKYFNGIEQHFPIKERFLRIDRFVMSKDGFSILIVGLKFDTDRVKTTGQIFIEEGMFLYEVNPRDTTKISLKQEIFFAQKLIQPKENAPPKAPKSAEGNGEDDEGSEKEQENEGIYKLDSAEVQRWVLTEYPEDEWYDEKDKYYPTVHNDDYEEDLNVEQSDDEDDSHTAASFNYSASRSRQQSEASPVKVAADAVEVGRQLPSPEKIQKVKCKFEGFDLPYLFDNEKLDELLEHFDDALLKEDLKNDEMQVTVDVKTFTQNSEWGEGDKNRIKKVFDNLHLSLNENGHIFLINRLSNKVYFFYADWRGDYKVYKLTIPIDFKVIGADSSGDYMILWSKKDFKIYDIAPLLYGQQSNANLAGQNQRVSITQRPVEYNINEFKNQVMPKRRLADPKKNHLIGDKKQEGAEIEEYNFNILDVYLKGDRVIFKIHDDTTDYLKIFDFKRQLLINYVEYEQVLVSGDKKFIWMVLENKVYDIENDLATLFIWPGGQVNLHTYDSLDIFNVTKDRTIMATQGYLQLAFNLISTNIDFNESIETILEPTKNYSSRHFYLAYRLSTEFSLLDRIANMEVDVSKLSKSFKQSRENLELEQQSQQQQMIQRLLNYLNSLNSSGDGNHEYQCLFFLSFFRDDPNTPNFGSEALKRYNIYKEDPKINVFQILFKQDPPRYDIIEEILRSVVKCVSLPITQLVINKSFLEFLKTADTSQAFKEYLENAIVKTASMEKVEKYPIAQQESGNKLGTYISPIMDEGFNAKFTDEKESKKDVQIQYIFLGDLLEQKGEAIMEELSDPRFLEIMSIPFIKHLVQYQWNSVQRNIKEKTLYPFYSLLAIFSVFSLLYVNYATGKEGDDPLGHLSPGGKVQYELLVLLLIANICYFLYIEIRQFVMDPKDYFSSFWNLTDLISYTLCMMVVWLDLLNLNKTFQRPVASVALIILWIKLFYFLRVYDSTSQLIRMIIEIVNDMKNYLIVLTIGIVGFTGGLFIMQQGLDGLLDESNEKEWENNRFVGDSLFKAFIYTYRMTLGDFQLDAFGVFEEKGLIFEFYFLWIIFIAGSLFLVIVLLNLLIAIMGETFSRVQEALVNLSIRERVLLVSENESLFDRHKLFKNAQYLVIISQKKIEGSQEDSVEGHIDQLRTDLVQRVANLETELKTQITETQKELRKRFQESEDKQKKHSLASGTKYEEQVKESLTHAVTKINDLFQMQQVQIAKLQGQVGSVGEQVRVMKLLQDQMDRMKKAQRALTKNLYSHLNIVTPKDQADDDDDE